MGDPDPIHGARGYGTDPDPDPTVEDPNVLEEEARELEGLGLVRRDALDVPRTHLWVYRAACAVYDLNAAVGCAPAPGSGALRSAVYRLLGDPEALAAFRLLASLPDAAVDASPLRAYLDSLGALQPLPGYPRP